MAKLSKRMLMNVTLIPPGGRVADIGCDHAMVPIYLVSEGVADYVIAMDVNEGPLDIARSNIKKAKLEDKIEIRLSDGAEAIELIDGSPECDTILIAGMGGHLALRIIERQLEKFKSPAVVLQVQSDIEYVRERLDELSFVIEDEEMTIDAGKYYFAMRIRYDDKKTYTLSCTEKKYGPRLISTEHALLPQYLRGKRAKYEQILSVVNEEKKGDILEEIREIDSLLGRMYGKG